MAGRPTKQGIDYFPLDVDFFSNTKVRKIAKACGPQAASILVCLLCNIYQKNGYYILWEDDVPFVIADQVGVTEGLVIEVVKKALQVDFFDQGKFDQYHILTSDGIQKRYGIATYQRKEISFFSDYLTENHTLRINCANNTIDCANNMFIVKKKSQKPINCANNSINCANNSINHTRNEQSINNKERILSNDNIPKKDELSLTAQPKNEKIDWDAFVAYYNQTFNGRLAAVRKLTESRRTIVKARVAQYGKESVREVYRKILDSNFLLGENNRGWRADFDWIFKQSNYTKILEGVYDNENRNNSNPHGENWKHHQATKQEVNDYALQQYLADRQRIEEGLVDEGPKPF